MAKSYEQKRKKRWKKREEGARTEKFFRQMNVERSLSSRMSIFKIIGKETYYE